MATHLCRLHSTICTFPRNVGGSRPRRNRWPKQEALPSSANEGTQIGRVLYPQNDRLSWDSSNVGNPVVSCFVGDNEQRWFMYYTGRSDQDASQIHSDLPLTGSTGVVSSSDGLHWTRPSTTQDNVVLQQNTDMWWAFDTEAVAVSDVQIMFSQNVNSADGVFWMYYVGISEEKKALGSQAASCLPLMRPGLAMSQDGYNWARIEGEHYSGSLFEVGEENEWDALFIGRPQVLNCGNEDLRMYYHSFDAQEQKFKVGWAGSKNGIRWQKRAVLFAGSNKFSFDAKGAAAQCVVYDVDNGQFVMFFEAVDGADRHSLGLAVSQDGLTNWDVYGEPVLSAHENSDAWDSGGVGTPWAVSMENRRWRIYYAGTSSTPPAWKGIGVCVSVENGPKFYGVPAKYRRRDIS